MGRALYRKHRPKSLKEVVGQEHITNTLEKALKQGRISHAYLFTGPRGVGKTSVARILAHQINGLTYTDDSAHIDIIEIDAASNRRIDEIRELREKVYVAPANAKYKVYIIDEVHMLTREAFNALLKTLEEPPAHVIFILATTDVHKLPETIISRTQRFSFRPGEPAKVVDLLKNVAAAEKMDVSDEAFKLIADHSDGSFRDAMSLLDQATSQGSKVDATGVEHLLGLPSDEAIEQLIKLIGQSSSPAELMQHLSTMYNQGYQASVIAKQLSKNLRQQLAVGTSYLSLPSILNLLSSLVEVPASHDPERALEIALLRVNSPKLQQPTQNEKVSQEQVSSVADNADSQPQPKSKRAEEQQQTVEPADNRPFDKTVWPEVLKALKHQYNTLYGVVRMAQPSFTDTDKLKLAFAFSFHQKRLNETSNRQKLIGIIHQLTGHTVEIECIVDKAANPPKIDVDADKQPSQQLQKTDSSDLSAISSIFGNAELLES